MDAREPLALERTRVPVGVEVGRADPLERARRASPFRQVRAFEKTAARIDARGVRRRHVRRGRHPGQPGVLPEHRPAPASHRDHREPAADGVPFVEVGRQLTDCHAMTDRERIEAHERREGGVRHVALDERAAERVGPVEHDDPNAVPRARAHGERHRPHEGVVAGADVLQIHHDRVDSPEHRGGRLAARAVEAPNRQARRRVTGGGDERVILGRAPQAMLGRQELDELDSAEVAQQGGRVLVVPIDRRLMRQQRDPLAPQERRTTVDEHLETRFDGKHRPIVVACGRDRLANPLRAPRHGAREPPKPSPRPLDAAGDRGADEPRGSARGARGGARAEADRRGGGHDRRRPPRRRPPVLRRGRHQRAPRRPRGGRVPSNVRHATRARAGDHRRRARRRVPVA